MVDKEEGWYCRKTYPHFDAPLPFVLAKALVSDPLRVKKHSFYPFLSFDITVRRYSKTKKEPKIRPIKYASHRDGYIFSYYAKILSQSYEKILQQEILSDVVLAYRSDIGSNITFAKDAFDVIKSYGDCVAVGFDIKGFFDNIDHKTLKKQWCLIIGNENLPDDHYAVFKAITKYACVDRNKCYERLNFTRKQKEKKRPICTKEEFKKFIRSTSQLKNGLIKKNKADFGIPQGSSISAILANVYMLPFDKKMDALAQEIGGYYRRYCDDILWICPLQAENRIKLAVDSEIRTLGKNLEIQSDKTQVAHFHRQQDGSVQLKAGEQLFQYLGFTFDGKRCLLRSQTLSKYWRKVRFGIRRAKINALKARRKGRNGKLFKRKIYQRYTYLGGYNFITGYVKRASEHMTDTGKSMSKAYQETDVWKQVKRHWTRVQKELS